MHIWDRDAGGGKSVKVAVWRVGQSHRTGSDAGCHYQMTEPYTGFLFWEMGQAHGWCTPLGWGSNI